MKQMSPSAVLLAGAILGVSLCTFAGDEPATKRLFADENWYKDADAKEQVFEGILRKEPNPMATSGRWNPVRLVIDEKTTLEVYLGGNTAILDDYVGLNVRLVGKPQVVLGHHEIWPDRIEKSTKNGLRVTLVEKTPPLSAAPAGAAPRTGCFLRWESVGTNVFLLGGLFETACASGHVFVKGPDGTLAPERQYREQGHWTERLIEPGKPIETEFNPWFWVQKPRKPGTYEVWVEYEVTTERSGKASHGTGSAGHWQGKIMSNRLELEVE